MALETNFAEELETLRKICLELEEKSRDAEIRCLMLETKVENFNKLRLEFEEKSQKVEIRVLVLETEVENLKNKNQVLEGKIETIQKVLDDSTNVKNKMEKNVLECEQRKAETELCFWKEKVKELESNTKCIDEKFEEDVDLGSKGTKEPFVEDVCLNKKMAPSAKRRRTANIITSDDEDSYDDNVPICRLKTLHSSWISSDSEEEVNENVSRRHPRRLRKSESNNKQDKSSIDLYKALDSSEEEEENNGVDEVESGDESLGGFIVDSPKSVYNSDSERRDGVDESKVALNKYRGAMDKIGRKKTPNLEWDLEADMLSDFAKDPVLCMSAVCALYRQQTADEQASKETRYRNGRGFSQPDASRASELAEFLMDGNHNKTVEELIEYDPNGVEECTRLATKYSKQLFEIYQNKEDPYFPPHR